MYKDNNRLIFEEIAKQNSLKRGEVVGKNNSGITTVTSLGSFYSSILNSEIYVALKEYGDMKRKFLNRSVARELGLFDLIEKELPNRMVEFPQFHGVLINSNKEALGVLTEDFSKGGTTLVKNVSEYKTAKVKAIISP